MAQILLNKNGTKLNRKIIANSETCLNAYHMAQNQSWMTTTNYMTPNPIVMDYLQMMKNPSKAALMDRLQLQLEARMNLRTQMKGLMGPCWHCQEPNCLSLDDSYHPMAAIDAVDKIYSRIKHHPDSIHVCRTLLNCPHENEQNHRLLYHDPLYTITELQEFRNHLIHEMKVRQPAVVLEEGEEPEVVGMITKDLHNRTMILEASDLLEYHQPTDPDPVRSQILRDLLVSPKEAYRLRRSSRLSMMRSLRDSQGPHPCINLGAASHFHHRDQMTPTEKLEHGRQRRNYLKKRNESKTRSSGSGMPKLVSLSTRVRAIGTSQPKY